MTRIRSSAIRRRASEAGWPVPVHPPAGAPPEAFREWGRLHKRLRWALRTSVDLISNVRPGAKLARLRAAAKQRGFDVELTLEDYAHLIAAGRCHYCDARPPETGHGIDRKDPLVGYALANVVVACDACNRIKGDVFSYEQMLEIGELLRGWRTEGRWADPQRKDRRRFGGRPPKGDLRREIEDWNVKWLSKQPDSLDLPFSGAADIADGSDLVRERLGTYAVEDGWSELLDELDDDSALAVGSAWTIRGSEAHGALAP